MSEQPEKHWRSIVNKYCRYNVSGKRCRKRLFLTHAHDDTASRQSLTTECSDFFLSDEPYRQYNITHLRHSAKWHRICRKILAQNLQMQKRCQNDNAKIMPKIKFIECYANTMPTPMLKVLPRIHGSSSRLYHDRANRVKH